MLVSSTFAILANPRCGAGSLAAAYGAEPLPGLPRYATTQEARDAAGDAWRSVPLILPVRDPLRRFLSAIRAADSSTGAPTPDEVLAQDALALLKDGFPDDRRDLWPQSRWMTAAVDHVLPLSSLHLFVSTYPPAHRVRATNTSHAGAMQLSKQTIAAVRELYVEDFARFATLPVYPSGDGRIWLMSGRCIPCEQAVAASTARTKATTSKSKLTA